MGVRLVPLKSLLTRGPRYVQTEISFISMTGRAVEEDINITKLSGAMKYRRASMSVPQTPGCISLLNEDPRANLDTL